MNPFTQKNFPIGFALLVILTYMAGALNYAAYLPDSDFLRSLDSAVVAFLALGFYWWHQSPHKPINLSAYSWLALLVLILVQTVIIRPSYPDSLIFPLVALALVFFLSWSVGCFQGQNRQRFITVFLAGLLLTGLINATLLIVQLYYQDGAWWIAPVIPGYTPYANATQRNIAATNTMVGLCALLFFAVHSRNISVLKYRRVAYYLSFFGFMWLSIALGVSMSRIGFLMAVCALTAFAVLKQGSRKSRSVTFIGTMLLFLLSYGVGQWLFQVEGFDGSMFGRRENNVARLSFLAQAVATFADHPILGAGWGSFSAEGLKRAPLLEHFSFSNHSHFWASQIAAEMGILGLVALLPLGLVFLRATKWQMNIGTLSMWLIALSYILHSCTEFPLWYFYHLMVFALVMALLTSPPTKLQEHYQDLPYAGRVLSLVCVCAAMLSVYYHYNYTRIGMIFHAINKLVEEDANTRMIAYRSMPDVFGLSDAKESFLFAMLPINTENLQEKIDLGYRVVHRFQSNGLFLRQGALLSLDGKKDQATYYLYAACTIDYHNCTAVKSSIAFWAKQNPQAFDQLLEVSRSW